jgi:hypothetical protein
MEAFADLEDCSIDRGDPSCPAGGWRNLDEQYFQRWKLIGDIGLMPDKLSMPGRSSLRQLHLTTRTVYSYTSRILYGSAFTLATVSPSVVADALVDLRILWTRAVANSNIGRFKYRRDAILKTKILQPLVIARCEATNYTKEDVFELRFPSFKENTLNKGPGTAPTSAALIQEWILINNTDIHPEIARLPAIIDHPLLYWIDDTYLLQSTQSSLMVVAMIPESKVGPAACHTCIISSRLAPMSVKVHREGLTHVHSEYGVDALYDFHTSSRTIKLTAKWATYLNPVISTSGQSNATVFSTLTSTAGVWASERSIGPEWYPIIIENILATLVVNGIGRANFNKTMAGNLIGAAQKKFPKPWMRQILPQNERMGYGGAAYEISDDDQKRATKLVLTVDVLGYAYGLAGPAQKAAMAVLSLYVLLVTCHIFCSSIFGWYTSSWGTASELTALAMNSTPSDKLENTGGGIDTINVFKEKVNIRLKGGRAQMVFRDTMGGEKLKEGEEYA